MQRARMRTSPFHRGGSGNRRQSPLQQPTQSGIDLLIRAESEARSQCSAADTAAVDGQFDDAIEPLTLSPHVRDYSQARRIAACVPSRRNPHSSATNEYSRLTRPPLQLMPTYNFSPPPLPRNCALLLPQQSTAAVASVISEIPLSRLQHEQQRFIMLTKGVHRNYFTACEQANASAPRAEGRFDCISIAPRPHNLTANQRPNRSNNATKSILKGYRATAFGTTYGTKLGEKHIRDTTVGDTTQISPFYNLIADHPSDLLMPVLDVNMHPHLRLNLLPFMDRDKTERPVVYEDMVNVDVLLGRGGLSNNHSGNLWFRNLVATYRSAYNAAPKGEKGQLARNLCNYVRLSGGRFLEKDRDRWYECGDTRAQAKCSQALREVGSLALNCAPPLLGARSSQGHCNETASIKHRQKPKCMQDAVGRIRQIELSKALPHTYGKNTNSKQGLTLNLKRKYNMTI